MLIEMDLDEAQRLASLAEVGAKAMVGEPRIAGIQQVRNFQAKIVMATARKPKCPGHNCSIPEHQS